MVTDKNKTNFLSRSPRDATQRDGGGEFADVGVDKVRGTEEDGRSPDHVVDGQVRRGSRQRGEVVLFLHRYFNQLK